MDVFGNSDKIWTVKNSHPIISKLFDISRKVYVLKGMVHPQMKIMSVITHPDVVLTP